MTDAFKTRVFYPEDWALGLESEHDEYMERLYETVDGEPVDDDGHDIVDVTGNYFCGCSTCERRASWTFLMIRIVEAYQAGLIELEEVSAEDG